jgi:hypothetical protein
VLIPSIDSADLLGLAAGSFVLATFSVRSFVPLRAMAIASNVLFMAYALQAHLLPILVLHGLLLPLNAVRLWQLVRTGRAPAAARPGSSTCERSPRRLSPRKAGSRAAFMRRSLRGHSGSSRSLSARVAPISETALSVSRSQSRRGGQRPSRLASRSVLRETRPDPSRLAWR